MHASKEFFAFKSDAGWGIMGMDNKERVKAQYNFLIFADQDNLMWVSKGEDKASIHLMDVDGKEIGDGKYEDATRFNLFKGVDKAFVKASGKWMIIDRRGKRLADIPEMTSIFFRASSDDCVEGNNPDPDKIIAQLQLDWGGTNVLDVYGYSLFDTPETFVSAGTIPGTSESFPQHYTNKKFFIQNISECYAQLKVRFPKAISTDGYRYNNITPDYFTLVFPDRWG